MSPASGRAASRSGFPANTRPSSGPIMRAPAVRSSVLPDVRSRSAQRRQASRTSGMYGDPRYHASRIIRVSLCADPMVCGGV